MAEQANSISIPVKPAASYLPGSVGWVHEQLRQAQLEVREAGAANAYSRPAMYIGFNGKATTLLAFVGAPKQFGVSNVDSDRYEVRPAPNAIVADRMYSLAPDKSDGKEGLFYYLTPAARRVVAVFIDEALAAFRAALDHDDDVADVEFRVEFKAAA